MIRGWALVVGGALTMGCAELRPITAPPQDLEDYRAFRVAAAEGTRLARAKRYLDQHPKGRFADEVRGAYEEEEPRWFEKAQASREGLRRYLADLPEGPHAEAALALLVAYGSSMKDAELRDIARRVRFEDAKLEVAATQRRAVGETILAAVGIFLDDDVYGVPRQDAPPKLKSLMLGRRESTWGSIPRQREEDLFFMLPTRPDRESRLLTLEITVEEVGSGGGGSGAGLVAGARIEGSDMFVRWTEADQIARLDSSALDDRTEAQIHAMSRLEGALERRFPAASCADLRKGQELYHRRCEGWEGVVIAGANAGDKDAIVLRAPVVERASKPARP